MHYLLLAALISPVDLPQAVGFDEISYNSKTGVLKVYSVLPTTGWEMSLQLVEREEYLFVMVKALKKEIRVANVPTRYNVEMNIKDKLGKKGFVVVGKPLHRLHKVQVFKVELIEEERRGRMLPRLP